MKNKVEVQHRRANLSSNKKDRVKDPICDANVKHTMLNSNSELICVKCKQCMFDANHDACFLDFVNDVNLRSKSKSAKQTQQHNILKPMGKVFIKVGYKWKPTGRLFTLVGCLDCSLVSGLWMLKIYDKKLISAHELHGVDLLLGSRDINLVIISLDDMLKTSPIYLLSKASKTKIRLCHRRLSYLNFGTLNKLAKDGLARGIPKFKLRKDHLCAACALGKSKKSSHQPKAKETNQEKFYLLHMDLCGPMRVESINGKKYILVIVYLRFTWVKFLRSKDEVPDVQEVATPRAVDLADSRVSTSIDKVAPSTSIPSTQDQEQSLIISQGVEEFPKTPHFHDDPLHETLHKDSTSQRSS
nr:hypothetical protein [Tanacetum cinerariifolium]